MTGDSQDLNPFRGVVFGCMGTVVMVAVAAVLVALAIILF